MSSRSAREARIRAALACSGPDGAGDIPLDEGGLAGVGEPGADVPRSVHALDGAALAAAVALFGGLVLHRDLRPVQGVQFLPQLLGVALDREHVVRQQLLADQRRVGLDGVPGIGGDDVPGQRVVPVQVPEQRREPRHLVGLGPDQPPGEHDRGAVGNRSRQIGDHAILAGHAAYRLAVHGQRGQPARRGQGMSPGRAARAGRGRRRPRARNSATHCN
jgi:hypothetical protein